MINHRSPISGVACLDDRYVATAGYDSQLILWDARTQTAVARARHDHLANHCTFSPDGRFLLSGSSDHTVRLWSVPDLGLLAVMRHSDDIERVAFSPRGDRFATASRDYAIRVFDLTGQRVHLLEGHAADAVFVEFSPDGRELWSTSDDADIRRWDVETGELLQQVSFGDVQLDTIAMGPEGVLYAGNDAGEILILKDGQVRTHQAHALGIKCLAYSGRESRLASTGYDGFLRTFRTAPDGSLTLEAETRPPREVWLRTCALDSRDRVIVGTFGSSYATFDIGSRRWDLSRVGDTPGLNAVGVHAGAIMAIGDAGVLYRDGVAVRRIDSLCNFLLSFQGQLLTGGQTGTLFDALTGQVLFEQPSPINCAVEVQRGGESLVVMGTYSGDAWLLARAEGRMVLRERLSVFRAAIKGLAVHGGTLFATCADRTVAHISLSTLEVTRTANAHERITNGAAALPDGRFASVGRDLMLRVWRQGQPSVFPTPHGRSVRCVASCPQTMLLATAAYDGTVALFDAARGEWLKTERLTDFGISTVSRGSRPGQFLASAYDGCVYEVSRDAAPRRVFRASVDPFPTQALAA
ncbi:WD40 repeat domain-containing protein [Corallococcus sp. CA047B]|uniref:WD40 repeat domain-containing protein n=1 Tax=Corallococcus sp. CA047B TaxID=2316729 RepID=UPI000EA07646|nr:WD40 repeat domain-containing protein [Corallococcus sp. CA047B]RKH10158.1 WD40 repeat domain-containing protein [Corallococcus sp. CA047B]